MPRSHRSSRPRRSTRYSRYSYPAGSGNGSSVLTRVSRNPRPRYAAPRTSELQFNVGPGTSSSGPRSSAASTNSRQRSHPSAIAYSGTTAYTAVNNALRGYHAPLAATGSHTGYAGGANQVYPMSQGNCAAPGARRAHNNPSNPAIQDEDPSIRWMLNGSEITQDAYTTFLSTGQIPPDLPPQAPYIPNSQHPIPIAVRDPYRDYTGPVVRGNPREFHGIQEHLTASGGSRQVLGITYGNLFAQLGSIGQQTE